MLQAGDECRNRVGSVVTIGGNVGDVGDPYVWSIQGDWYDKETGQFVSYYQDGSHKCHPNSWKNLVLEAGE